jgi:hypothetical protein
MARQLAVLLLLSAVTVTPAVAREGFGFSKKAVEMTRTIPPALTLGSRHVKVTVKSERASRAEDAQTLQRYVEDAILSGGGTLATGAKGDVNVTVSVDRLDSHEAWETRTDYEYQQTGTKQEWNSKKNRYEEKPVYGNVPVEKNVKNVTGSLTGAYDIGDRGGVIDSGSLSLSYGKKFDDGKDAPPPTQVEDDLLHRAARTVAARLVPVKDRVNVIMPKGSFENFIPIAESGAWDRYLAAVQAVPEMRDRRAEAYRQYALALGTEGTAYMTDDPQRALAMIREAVTHYQNAISWNPDETIFAQAYSSLLSKGAGAPLARANESLAAYERWATHGGGAPTRVASSAPQKQTLRNQTIVDMVHAGLSDENVILAIDSADHTEFDTSPQALIDLAHAGVSRNVIARMQKKTRR